METKLMDEKGFIFLDKNQRPFLCAKNGESSWLFYWHVDKKWVSLRPVTQSEIWSFPRNLSEEHQDVYREMHEKNMKRELSCIPEGFKFNGN